jgi:hypothetical protein
VTFFRSASTAFMAVRAAACGTMVRKQMIRIAGGATIRCFTLPPGSIRSFPTRGPRFYDDHMPEHDDDDRIERHALITRTERAIMSPGRVRRYATSSLEAPIVLEYSYNGFWTEKHISFDEDYDEWNLHGAPPPATQSDLGQVDGTDPVSVEDVTDVEVAGRSLFSTTILTGFEYDTEYDTDYDTLATTVDNESFDDYE